ncbi:MAG TPA: ParB/Srx family N-terminal domain-containing protein [Anaerolineae bacterium]|nr:ParB/Srx family N-terminal domain-containing protein [Anaerolineae bacterium]HQJ10222.1 ParB/Srx family N-terminal domain-containing protein [Anaerolineae bacterium]
MADPTGPRRYLPLKALQPSQLYISVAKLAAVAARWQPPSLETLEPIPIKALDGRLVLTDGHTRAYAALRHGFTEIPIVWDEEALDWDAYRICVAWCLEAGITTVMDLAERLLTAEDDEVLWHERCRVMQATLAVQREANGSGA